MSSASSECKMYECECKIELLLDKKIKIILAILNVSLIPFSEKKSFWQKS